MVLLFLPRPGDTQVGFLIDVLILGHKKLTHTIPKQIAPCPQGAQDGDGVAREVRIVCEAETRLGEHDAW